MPLARSGHSLSAPRRRLNTFTRSPFTCALEMAGACDVTWLTVLAPKEASGTLLNARGLRGAPPLAGLSYATVTVSPEATGDVRVSPTVLPETSATLETAARLCKGIG